jgi:haloalkane dehalogenase
VSSWRVHYPFASHFRTIDGLQYHYLDEGQGDQPIVCVHGNPTWSFYYRRILHDLRDQQRVLAVDHIGCGLSEKPVAYNYTLAQHTPNLVQWLDHLDLHQVLMIVHDWGGAIGLGAALQRPERVGKLLLLNTGAFPPPYVPLRIAACRLPWLGSWAIRHLNAFAYPATFMAIDRLKRLAPEAKAGLLAPYDSPGHRVAIDAFVRDIPLGRTHPTYRTLEELESKLPELSRLPIRIVWGMKDWCFRPECLDRFLRAWPDAHVQRLDDVGHYVMEEAPQEVVDQVRQLLSAK